MHFSKYYARLLVLLFFTFSWGAMQEQLHITWGLSARQGKRPTMEDAHAHIVKNNQAFFGIFDGHGGNKAAEIAAKKLPEYFFNTIPNNPIQKALVQAFEKTDAQIGKETDSGTTALVAYINIEDKTGYFAWAGDSRGLVIRNSKIIAATQDHKPDSPHEQARIESFGGKIDFLGVPRINGLAVSRSLGDREYKQMTPNAIIALPDIKKWQISAGDVILLACDGVWDVVSNEQAAQLVINALKSAPKKIKEVKKQKGELSLEDSNSKVLLYAARVLRDTAYEKGSQDNISVLVIQV